MLTKTRLHELLYYSQETGLFTWIKSAGTRAVIGKEAGRKYLQPYQNDRIGTTTIWPIR